MIFLAGGLNGLPLYQGELDMTGSETEKIQIRYHH